MNFIEKLKANNIEVTAEMEKILSGDFISVQEHEKKIARVEVERDNYLKNFNEATEKLKTFNENDIAKITHERDELKASLEAKEKEYSSNIAKRDYSDAVKESIKDLKFSSLSAKKNFISELEAKQLSIKDGKLTDFDKFVDDFKKTDEEAFLKDTNKDTKITAQIKGTGSADDNLAKIRAVMGLK